MTRDCRLTDQTGRETIFNNGETKKKIENGRDLLSMIPWIGEVALPASGRGSGVAQEDLAVAYRRLVVVLRKLALARYCDASTVEMK